MTDGFDNVVSERDKRWVVAACAAAAAHSTDDASTRAPGCSFHHVVQVPAIIKEVLVHYEFAAHLLLLLRMQLPRQVHHRYQLRLRLSRRRQLQLQVAVLQ